MSLPNASLSLAWAALLIAGVFEWGWPVGLKLGWSATGKHSGWIAFSAVCMLVYSGSNGVMPILVEHVFDDVFTDRDAVMLKSKSNSGHVG